MKFTTEKAPDDPWGVTTEYVALELTTGAILAPLNDDQINGKHGPFGANQRGGNWVWAKIEPGWVRALIEPPAQGDEALLTKLKDLEVKVEAYGIAMTAARKAMVSAQDGLERAWEALA